MIGLDDAVALAKLTLARKRRSVAAQVGFWGILGGIQGEFFLLRMFWGLHLLLVFCLF